MWVSPEHKYLQYSGRIDFDDPAAPVLVYVASYIRIRFTGTGIRVALSNRRSCWSNSMGYLIDGEQKRIVLDPEWGKKTYTLAEGLAEGEHELLLFKRQDACHYVTFYGFELDGDAEVLPLPPKPSRRIEVYGDSVSCGEVSEAVEYVGKQDPEHDGQYSNGWYSYAWMTARKLNAELHDISQGGISLLDDTGWFAAPEYKGVESCYDKLEYHPDLGPVKPWDFSKYIPQVVIVAIGQNDNHPVDYMAEDYNSEKSENWRRHYQAFIEKLMQVYPRTQIILTTTILMHDASWDRSIDEVCNRIASPRVHHFLYSRNGAGTPGHIRIPEAEEMAKELAGYIDALGEEIWNPIDYEHGISNEGNLDRLKHVLERATRGEALKLGFLGGSITQGSLSSRPELCYAHRVFDWWKRTFPQTEFTYINAGIGGTTSQFGVARADSDLLAMEPDFVIIEFSVNDDSTEHFLETYEGLVRKVYTSKSAPAVLLVHNVFYNNGASAQLMHGKIARHYHLPAVSMQSSIYPELLAGRIANRDITPDDLHPNDAGHGLVASMITYFIEKVRTGEIQGERTQTAFPTPLSANAYEQSVRYRNDNAQPKTDGFVADIEPQRDITDCFKLGWTASQKGASITFRVPGSCIAVQYRKSVKLPAPIAEIIVDDDAEHAVRLDANFDETWGDKLELDTILEHGEDKEHKVVVRLVETHPDDAVPFYLVSVIGSR